MLGKVLTIKQKDCTNLESRDAILGVNQDDNFGVEFQKIGKHNWSQTVAKLKKEGDICCKLEAET